MKGYYEGYLLICFISISQVQGLYYKYEEVDQKHFMEKMSEEIKIFVWDNRLCEHV